MSINSLKDPSPKLNNDCSTKEKIKVAIVAICLGLIFIAIVNLSGLDLSPYIPPPPLWEGHLIDYALIAGGIAVILLLSLTHKPSPSKP